VIPILIVGGILIGLVIGTIGAGSGIVAVPVIQRATGFSQSAIVPHSLVIVAVSAVASSIAQFNRKAVDVRAMIEFGVSGAIGAVLGAQLALNTTDALKLWTFAALTTFVGFRYLFSNPDEKSPDENGTATAPTGHDPSDAGATVRSIPLASVAGLLSGLAGGLTGVGGGFILIPVMVGAMKMPMHRAVATTGAVVGINAIFGVGRFAGSVEFHWDVLGILAVLSIAAAPLGVALSHRLPPIGLRRIFGGLVLAIGLHAMWRAVWGALSAG
jgi:uncharacterized membrane protein YfcA